MRENLGMKLTESNHHFKLMTVLSRDPFSVFGHFFLAKIQAPSTLYQRNFKMQQHESITKSKHFHVDRKHFKNGTFWQRFPSLLNSLA